MYHKELAPEGRQFTADQAATLDAGWVNTPAKFDPNYVEPTPVDSVDGLPKGTPRGYAPKPFPCIMYSRTGEDRYVRTQADLDALDPAEWKSTPAAFGDAAPAAAPPAPSPAPAAVTTSAAPQTSDEQAKADADKMNADAAELHRTPIAEVKLDGLDLAALDRLMQLEALSVSPRATLMKAIKARKADLQAAPQ